MSVSSDYPTGRIKSIQRGTITITGTTASATATITSVDPAKSILTMLGYELNHDGVTTTSNAQWVRLALTNSTTVTATRGNGTGPASSKDTVVGFQVVEHY